MKAIIRQKYGSPDVLQFEEVPKPTPGDDEVVVKLHAASVSSSDWEILTGSPYYVRPLFGILEPRCKILGSDIAGRVEAIGRNVQRFQPGDEIFGDTLWAGFGGFAEYVCVPENTVLAQKPASMSFAQAATFPQAAVIALQGLRDRGRVQAGQKVLINGAGGGAGSFAVQFAKSLGAEVTGVDSTRKLEMMRSIGADHVIDYTQEDFTRNGQRYDLILDVAAHHSTFDYARALSPNGIYAVVGGRMLQTVFLGPWISMIGSKRMGLLRIQPNSEDLRRVGELFETGAMVPVIDKQFPLDEAVEALRYFGAGLARGKVVITM